MRGAIGIMEDSTPRRDEATSHPSRPEMPTTTHWRAEMRQARERLNYTQADLGRRVGVSQNVISRIETGEQEASEFVLSISKVLNISPPFAMFTDALDERWFKAGRLIRQHDERMFSAQVSSMEAFAATLAELHDREV